VNNLWLFGFAIFILPWLVDGQQQHRPAVQQRHESPQESLEPKALHTPLEATKIPPRLENPLTPQRRKNTLVDRNNIKNDASAIATLAPANPAVALPATRRPSSTAATGLTSPHIARSLEDWEVEDFVLLATVDGKLYARDRKTGKEKWALQAQTPMVESTHNRRNKSSVEEDYDPLAIDDFIWVVEPSRDGGVYYYRPNHGLVDTGLTIKKLVDVLSPFSSTDHAVTYTGGKHAEMWTIDARNGMLLKRVGSDEPIINDQNCINTKGFVDKNTEECSTSSTLTIGRTEWTVQVTATDGHRIATLKYYEWVPNTHDASLIRQYHKTLDNKYIYPIHDGGIIGFDLDRHSSDQGNIFKQKLTSPVVRVFDVARPWGNEKDDPELLILPQPIPPQNEDEITASHRAQNVFVNQTEDGSWFAMSGKFYPLAVQGIGPAQCEQQGWRQHNPSWDDLSNGQLSKALVGLHSIEHIGFDDDRFLTISGPSLDDNQSGNGSIVDTSPALLDPPTWIERLQRLPRLAFRNLIEFIQNPVLVLMLAVLLIYNQRQLRTYVGHFASGKLSKKLEAPLATTIDQAEPPKVEVVEELVADIPSVDGSSEIPAVKVEEVGPTKVVDEIEKVTRTDSLEVPGADSPSPNPEEKKKKAHRGRRGGVRHKKGRDRAASQSGSQDPRPPATVEDAVREAQNMGEQPKIEPDIHTVSHDPTEVSGPILRVGALTVNTEKMIGTGSNGTVVFEGSFDGREVAVKRMLMQFFDIASQETKLLRESDDHPNVIRYFAQQQAYGFLYIALELCPASLADVIEKPHLHASLAQGGERDMPNVLYQIANGLQHLHNLRIVHRDLKPQNILVSMGKDGKPRLLVSDFGLCKKLEGEQSSFRATTAHAAGTSGWRAPELLLDDDAKEGGQGAMMVDASTNGDSGSGALVSAELMPNRRATRAIDIFSLGLVFFYVLTKGSHPFDCGDRYMREVNIRKNQFNLRQLDVLGDYAHEAKDLISSMLAPEPKKRPTAHQVMAHPFFWSAKKRLNFLCDVSDHFEKEKRDPPSDALKELESWAPEVCRGDFLKLLSRKFVDSLGKQRKYTGTRLLDLLRALRNKKNHYEDMTDDLKKEVGHLPEGYLSFWTRRFSNLLLVCWQVVYEVQWDETDRFREYYSPAGL